MYRIHKKIGGIPHAATMGQSRTSNYYGHSHKTLVTSRKSKKKIDYKKGAYLEGTVTNLCLELCKSLRAASRKYAPKHKKNMEKLIRWQLDTR